MFSDISFMVQNQEFFAHKNILAMRSEYFASMFLSTQMKFIYHNNKGGMQESQASQITVPDVSPTTFEGIFSKPISL